ncbi:Gfo/Idh/MocA family oxidoreductase [Priestia megaterium]|uniref:Gfo/Idh/MocA family protein n=1 Tax=Priestia megaterium TaxID=1404 RepID=UPI0021D69EAF|nr:Gfo/Idh/MocA family oxidoreductase [Priestia megaterium]MCU7712590.1 Gfo/Idh/MocA family oxidoreductase [Priestia megaterium]
MKVGVIGAGSMGEKHVRTYASLSNYCEFVGIYDKNKLRAREMEDKYQIKQFDSITELLKEVDIVSIAVPTEFHYEVGLACVDHNVHMLMEKPITSTIEQAKDLIAKANQADIKIQVGHIELYNPIIKLLKNILVDEKIISIDIHRMNPYDSRVLNVDVIHDLMIHDIYILKYLLNDEMTNFYAMGKIIDNTVKHAVLTTQWKKGIIAQMTASFKSMEKTRTIEVITEKSFIKANLLTGKIEIVRLPEQYMKQENNFYYPNVLKEIIEIPYSDPLKVEIIEFINCVKNNNVPLVNGHQGIEILSICNKASNFIKKST